MNKADILAGFSFFLKKVPEWPVSKSNHFLEVLKLTYFTGNNFRHIQSSVIALSTSNSSILLKSFEPSFHYCDIHPAPPLNRFS